MAVALEGVKRNEVHGGAFAVSNIALGSVIELQVRQPGRLIGDAKIQNAGVALDRGHVQPDAVDGTFLVTVKYVLERDAAMPAEGFGHTMEKADFRKKSAFARDRQISFLADTISVISEAPTGSQVHTVVGIDFAAVSRFNVGVEVQILRGVEVGAEAVFIPSAAKILREAPAMASNE